MRHLILILTIDALAPRSAIFQLYHGEQFQWWKSNRKIPSSIAKQLVILRFRVECTLFVICNVGCEPTPHWLQACISQLVIQLPYSLRYPGPNVLIYMYCQIKPVVSGINIMLMVDKIHGIYGLLQKSILGAFVEVRKIME